MCVWFIFNRIKMSLFNWAKVKFIEYWFFSTKSSCCSFKCLILESYQSDPNMCSIIVLVAWCLNTVKCVSMTCKHALNLYFTASIFHMADWWYISVNSILFICLLSSRRKFDHQISIDEWLTSTAVAVRWLPWLLWLVVNTKQRVSKHTWCTPRCAETDLMSQWMSQKWSQEK